MLEVIYSHRQEHLLELLAATLKQPLSHPLAPETVIVQSQGMGRWVQQQVAARNGIAANLNLVLPAQFMWQLYRLVLPAIPEQDSWNKDVLTWRIYQCLPTLLDDPAFQILAHYLQQDSPDLRLYQLSRQIADVLDHYLIYRPEWCREWASPKFNPATLGEHRWQALLWRQLTASTDVPHRAQLGEQLTTGLAQLTDGLPERLSIFGIPYMAAGYLDVLAQLAGKLQVTLYQFNPTPHYWGDIVSRKAIARLQQQDDGVAGLFDEGHRLLASWGVPLRDHIDHLLGLPQEEIQVFPEQEDSIQKTLLQHLQQDIFHLRQPLWPDHLSADQSLQIHSCHSPMREVEVLYDQLQALFQNSPEDAPLDPRDVVVMAADIGTYAPYIEAVFGAQRGEAVIPWSLADLSRTSDTPLVQVFLSFLDLLQGTFTAPEVMGLFEVPAISRRLGWDQEQLEQVRTWLQEAGIRFGWGHKEKQQCPNQAVDLFSWHSGLQRLLLGYMLPESVELYDDLAPYPYLQSGDADTLGSLAAQIERWHQWYQRLQHAQAPADWLTLLQSMMEALFVTPETPTGNIPPLDKQDAGALESLRETLQAWADDLNLAGVSEPIPFEIVKQELRQRLDSPNRRQQFLSGAVTFCAMIPMRSLPFRVVALLGMNQDLFPRQDQPLSFDLMAQSPRKGDRARRQEDRFLFLEALLSAREVFYLSYVGRSIKDNSERAPAVVVSEMLDLISEQGGKSLAAALQTEHRLQPFHPQYFQPDSPGMQVPVSNNDDKAPSRLHSYQQDWCARLSALSEDGFTADKATAFVPQPLPMPDPPWFSLETPLPLPSLLSFLAHPTRYFVRQRLNIQLEQDTSLDDREPFDLAALSGYKVRDLWMERVLAGQTSEHIEQVLRAQGHLPLGDWGEQWLAQMRSTTSALTSYAGPWLQSQMEPLEFDFNSEGLPLQGRLQQCHSSGLLRLFAGSLRGNRWLQCWAEHLVLNILQPADIEQRLHIVGISKGEIEAWELTPIPTTEALLHLGELLDCLQQCGSAPVPLFPQSALEYASALGGKKDPLSQALRTWYNEAAPDQAECRQPYHALVWHQVENPLDNAFETLTQKIWAPILNYRSRI